jgi:hypothetical protein
MKTVTAALLLLIGFTPAARAQDVVASSFDQLQKMARLGDEVVVTDVDGRHVKGKISDLSSSSLELLNKDGRLAFDERNVAAIARDGHASLSTGARWGFGVGAALGLLTGIEFARECYNGCPALAVFSTSFYGGLGAGIGVGIAAMIPAERPLYTGGKGTHVGVVPVVACDRQGVAVSLKF